MMEKRGPSEVEIHRLLEPPGADLEAMTFPAFAPLLSLAPQPIYPEQGDPVVVEPQLYLATEGGREVGLALAARPLAPVGAGAQLLSLFVAKESRRRGVGAALVAAAEAGAAASGAASLETVYTTGKASIPYLEKILAGRRWSPPQGRTLSVRFAPAAGIASDLLEPRRLRHQARGLDIRPWCEIPQAEKDQLQRSFEAGQERWIAPLLAPWRFDVHGYDGSSLGARFQGKLAGWVITHRVSAETVRLTCSFMHPELSRYGKILPLYGGVLEQLRPRCRWCSFVTPFSYPSMIAFIRRRLAPISEFVGETRASRLALASEVLGEVS
jgi:GNAT superfamily N-acetyltransferase